jgi:hypothetical protein
MLKNLLFLLFVSLSPVAVCQDAPAPAGKVPLDRVLGTITAVDSAAHTVTVKEDKTGTTHTIRLADAKTLLKVEPTAKDLKSAVRITADDLESGDRVDVRGSKLPDSPETLTARSVILMSGRDLEKTHQEQAAAWSHATSGRVTAVDAGSGKIVADVRSAGAVKSMVVQTSAKTEFSRYSPESGKPVSSDVSQIQVGDQLKILGEKNSDESMITAQRVYSGAFRTISATISGIGADGKSLVAKDLATKKDVNVILNADASLHRLPPMMAAMLARRLNPGAVSANAAPGGGAGTAGPTGEAPIPASVGPPTGAPPGGMPNGQAGPDGGRGDISQMIELAPKIAITDLKPGDAVVVSGVATGGGAGSNLLANTIIAGVEPILQSAPAQGGGRSVGGDWGLGEMSAPQ